MTDIIAEGSGNIVRIQLNRPDKKNAMTSSMYITMAELLEDAAKDDQVHVVLWHAAGDSFSAGNDLKVQASGKRRPNGPRGFAGLSHRFDQHGI